MAKVLKRIVSILFVYIILLYCTACAGAEIHSFSINDLPPESLGVGMTSNELKVEVDYFRSFQASDVNVVVNNDSIINIDYEVKESLLSGYYVSYKITGLKPGTTSYYFETSDHTIRSDVVEIEIAPNVKSIDFNDTSDIYLSENISDEVRYFQIQAYDDSESFNDIFVYISEDPNIATVEYKESYTSHCCVVKRVGAGETYIYVQTKDGNIQSTKIKVISSEDVPKDLDATESIDNSRTVYITNYGTKYHYSASCAGSNPIETTENSVKYSYDPCSKCVK